MQNEYIELIPADASLAEQLAEYYRRNREFLEAFEPARSEAFFSAAYQREILEKEVSAWQEKTAFRFYIRPAGESGKIIGMIGLNNVIWGAFCFAFMGYKLDAAYINRGYMSMAVEMVVQYAFHMLGLHRIEGNVMPRNAASLRVLAKNHFINEGISKYYLKINGRWEDHVHMVRINYALH